MARSRVHVHRAAAVVLRSLVLIPRDHGNWRAPRDAKLSARLNFDSVLLVSWRGERSDRAVDESSVAGYRLL